MKATIQPYLSEASGRKIITFLDNDGDVVERILVNDITESKEPFTSDENKEKP